MASGDSLFEIGPFEGIGNATNYPNFGVFDAVEGERAYLGFITNGGSADEIQYFERRVPSQYDGGGFSWVIDYSTDGTDTTNAIQFEVSMEVIQDADDQDAGGQDFGTVTDITDTPSTAAANVNDRTSAGTVSHANAGSPAAGDRVRIRIAVDHDHSANTDLVQFHGAYCTEA